MGRKTFDADAMVGMLLDMACQISYAYLGNEKGKEDLNSRIERIFPISASFVDATNHLNSEERNNQEKENTNE